MVRKAAIFSSRTGYFRNSIRRRTGGLLILVLIILAVSMILITSALMINAVARNRFYRNAEVEQTNLTALSVAKTIGEAVTSAEIKDGELVGLADNKVIVNVTSATGFGSASISVNNNSVAPGLANAADAKTTAAFGYYPSESDPKYISVIVKSTLNTGASTGTTDIVTLLLSKKESTIDAAAFANQVTLGSQGVDNRFLMFGIGYGNWENAANYLVFHGDVTVFQSGDTSNPHEADRGFTTDVIATDQLSLGVSTDKINNYELVFIGNLILKGDKASLNNSSVNNATFYKNIIALGSGASVSSIFTNTSGVDTYLTAGSFMNITGGVYLSNRSLSDRSNTSSKSRMNIISTSASGFAVDDSGVLTTNFMPGNSNKYFRAATPATLSLNGGANPAVSTSPIVTAIQAVADSYSTPEVTAYFNRKILTSDEALNSGMAEYSTKADVIASGAHQLKTELTSSTPMTLTDSAYYIDSTSSYNHLGVTSGNWPGSPTSITFNLASRDITIYVINSGTFTIGSGRFVFTNGGAHIGRIVLLDGSDLTLQTGQYYNNSSTSKAYETGIVGTSCPDAVWSDWPVTVRGYKPYVYIFGMGNNQIIGMNRSVLEAYIGLYGTTGRLSLEYYCYFFGRVESMYLSHLENVQGIDFPYCPGPNDLVQYMRQIVRSGYEVTGYITG